MNLFFISSDVIFSKSVPMSEFNLSSGKKGILQEFASRIKLSHDNVYLLNIEGVNFKFPETVVSIIFNKKGFKDTMISNLFEAYGDEYFLGNYNNGDSLKVSVIMLSDDQSLPSDVSRRKLCLSGNIIVYNHKSLSASQLIGNKEGIIRSIDFCLQSRNAGDFFLLTLSSERGNFSQSYFFNEEIPNSVYNNFIFNHLQSQFIGNTDPSETNVDINMVLFSRKINYNKKKYLVRSGESPGGYLDRINPSNLGSYKRGLVSKLVNKYNIWHENKSRIYYDNLNKSYHEKTGESIRKHLNSEHKKDVRFFMRNLGKRSYSTSHSDKDTSLNMFRYLNNYFESINYVSSKDNQIQLEKYLNDYNTLLKNKDIVVNNISTRYLGNQPGIVDKEKLIHKYIGFLFSTSELDLWTYTILHNVGRDYIFNVLLGRLLQIRTYSGSSEVKLYAAVNVGVKLGKDIVRKYLLNKKSLSDSDTTYSVWFDRFINKRCNKLFRTSVIEPGDTFYLKLGVLILDILKFSEIIDTKVVTVSHDEKRLEYYISDPKISDRKNGNMLVVPSTLPMIYPPKQHSEKEIGGYLLENIDYASDLFFKNYVYIRPSQIASDNKIYNMVNSVSNMPFKINKEVLSYINSERGNFLLISDKDVNKCYESKSISKVKGTEYESIASKYAQQEYILSIADSYKRFSSIYFPVKLCHRGRLYPVPSYLNYQSNALSKSLLLFSKPGIITKGNLENIKYLKAYGANLFSSELEKSSIEVRSQWVDKNEYNIYNYDNNILLNQAKEKLLFLAFCIEYKKFLDFYKNESIQEFQTHFPVQLDATSNGFQHLAMLSDETQLYDILNITNKDPKPNDFYSYLLHKVYGVISDKINKGLDLDEGSKKDDKFKGSYKSISNFVLNRTHVKKTIMTIPYSATVRSMKENLVKELIELEYDSDLKCIWYTEIGKEDCRINSHDVNLLVKVIRNVINTEYVKIARLLTYLRDVSKLTNKLQIPIHWKLPHGLIIYQGYAETKSITISPFVYSKNKLTIQSVDKNTLNESKQLSAFMPNLIHSLDAYSMCNLHEKFSAKYKDCQFFSVHDCFGTTLDKVETLKSVLTHVYTDLYLDNHYLIEFDKNFIQSITDSTNIKVVGRTVKLPTGDYELTDINWVINRKITSPKGLVKISNQHILI